MRLLRSIATISFFTLVSRFVGFFRTILMAALVGSGAMADALIIAIRIPSVLRRIFAEGAFNAAFVPIFAGILAKEGPENAKKIADQVFSILLFTLSAVIILIEIFMPEFLSVVVHGFDTDSARFAYTVSFTRITFVFILFISICALYSGVLNSLERFAFAASSPMFGNIGIIATVLSVKSLTDDNGTAFALGIAACSIIQALWVLVPAARAGFLLKPVFLKLTQPVKRFFKLLLPAALGAGVVQVNIFLDMIIGSYLPVGGISYLEYADRLNQLPLSTIGVAMGTALLPMLSKQLRVGDHELANRTQNLALEYAFMLAVPAMVGLFVLAVPIIQVVYTHGKLTIDQGLEIAKTLQAFSLGLPAFILVKVCTSIFYAHEDTKTPVVVGTIATVLNLVLNLILMRYYFHVGLALATSIAGWVDAIALVLILMHRGRFRISGRLLQFLPRIAIITLFLIAVLHLLKVYFWPGYQSSQLAETFGLVVMVVIGVLIFVVLSLVFGILKKDDLNIKKLIVENNKKDNKKRKKTKDADKQTQN